MITRFLLALFLLASLTLLVSFATAQVPGSQCSSNVSGLGPFPKPVGMDCWVNSAPGSIGLTFCKVRPASCIPVG
jgi:hypothetical protein